MNLPFSESESLSPEDILRWHLDAGVDESIAESPRNRFAAARAPAPVEPVTPNAPVDVSKPLSAPDVDGGAVGRAVHLAAGAATLEDLRTALAGFDGCPLKKTAKNLVFGDGNPNARIVLIGEAPGADEDRQGVPFVGASGKLLDKMLASIGLDRTQVFISNAVFWRPPGNRTPSSQETAVCLPFVERMIEIIDPDFLVTLGGAAAKTLLGRSESVGRMRGRWFTYSTPRLSRPVNVTVMFHPAYLLYSPAQKREAWSDLLGLRKKLDETARHP